MVLWQIRLFDGPLLINSVGSEARRFRSQRVGALLSYLALHLGHPVPREELAEALWPDELDQQVVANRLRVSLASLRRQLEPPGTPFGVVLDVSSPGRIKLREEMVSCDVVDLELALRAGDTTRAASIGRGSLLPGFYDHWIQLERHRLESLCEGLPTAPPPSQSAGSKTPTESYERELTLPLYLTQFFGREAELEELSEMLNANRLVTITGPGGMGKTRLAVEAGLRSQVPVAFVPLAELSDPSLIEASILRSLGVVPAPEASLSEQLARFLGEREATALILDNAEHLLDGVATVVLELLKAIPRLRIVVTSRQRMEIPGEALLQLNPLPTPSTETPYEELVRNPAVALFLDRARSARPDFVLSFRHAAPTLEICRLLEGMPLALELAAARVVSQNPTQIESALKVGLTQLRSNQRGLSSRHRSLRASIQGSFELLSPELRLFFTQLSVFRGGWTIDAARAITQNPSADHLLEELLLRSMVVAGEDSQSDQLRYGFLESIRQYALECLSAEEVKVLRERHSQYFMSVASEITEDDVRTMFPLDADEENLLDALESGKDSGQSGFSEGLAGALIYAHVRGKHRIFLPWASLAREIAQTELDHVRRFSLTYASYFIFSYVGRMDEVMAIGNEMLAVSDSIDYTPGIVDGHNILSYALCQSGNFPQSRVHSDQALTLARRSLDSMLIWRSLRIYGWILSNASVSGLLSPDDESEAMAASERYLRECLSLLSPHSAHIVFTQMTLSYVLNIQGESAEAYAQLKAAQKVGLVQKAYSLILFSFIEECRTAISRNQHDYASLLYGVYLELRDRTGYNHHAGNFEVHECADILVRQLGRDRFTELERRGRGLPLEYACQLSLDAPSELTAG